MTNDLERVNGERSNRRGSLGMVLKFLEHAPIPHLKVQRGRRIVITENSVKQAHLHM